MTNLKDLINLKLKKREIEVCVSDSGETSKSDVWLKTLPHKYVYPYKDDESGADISGLKLIAKRIAFCVVDEEGVPVFEEKHILAEGLTDEESPLPPLIIEKLNDLIIEENGLGKIYQSLLEKMNSGASSSSMESAEEQ